MDEVYSVTTNNRFALFMEEEDDPGDTILSPSKLPEKTDKKPEAKKNERGPKTKAKEVRERPAAVQNGRKGPGEATNRRRDVPPGMASNVSTHAT